VLTSYCEHMNEPVDEIEVDPAAFLTRTCNRLAAAAGTDAEIAAILTTMLTTDVGASAGVIPAREALRRLAVTRAAEPNVDATQPNADATQQ